VQALVKIGVLEATQLAIDTKLGTMEASVTRIDTSLAALLRHFDDLMTREHDQQQRHNNYNLTTTMLTVRPSIIAMAAVAINDVRYATMTMFFINSSLRYHLLMANMTLMLIFLGNWPLNKNLHVLNSLKMLGLEQPLMNSLIFTSIWWIEYGTKHPDDIPQTWVALKWVMRGRFVPSYYARDLKNKLQQLKQGAKSVEEYYQELEIGMLC
jgi:hypothetical protein